MLRPGLLSALFRCLIPPGLALCALASVCAQPGVAASSHLLWLKPDGSVWAGGEANNGARGDGPTPELRNGFRKLAWLSGVKDIAVRDNSSAALLDDGALWAWGMFSSMSSDSKPQALPGLGGVRSFALGDDFIVATKGDGGVWFFGDARFGLNAGLRGTEREAVRIPGLSGVVAVGATDWSAYAVLQDGSVWGWGNGFANLLGAAGRWDFFNPDKNANPKPLKISGVGDVVAISGGRYHVLALTRDGRVYAWGDNEDGALGRPLEIGIGGTAYQTPGFVNGLPRVKAVAAGYDFSLAIDLQGQVWVWGNNTYGTLGVPSQREETRFEPKPLQGVQGAVSVRGGHYHAFAVLANGDVVGWGSNDHGFVPFAPQAPSREIGPTRLK